jgi:hypothetical protein
MKIDITTVDLCIAAMVIGILASMYGIMSIPLQTSLAFLDAPIPPTNSSNSTNSTNSTGLSLAR